MYFLDKEIARRCWRRVTTSQSFSYEKVVGP